MSSDDKEHPGAPPEPEKDPSQPADQLYSMARSNTHGQGHKSDPKKAPGATGRDAADNPSYDKNASRQTLDGEILVQRRIAKWMTILAACFLLAFTATFFVYAIYFAHGFIDVLGNHVHALSDANGDTSIIPLLFPFMPATLFAALGIATMVTAMRFVNAYVNAVDDRSDHGTNLERLAREIAAIVKNFKSGGNE